jgi:hypothetical protein
MAKCGLLCEVFSRVCGYMRPVSAWNIGKTSEWADRVEYDENVSVRSDFARGDSPVN